jgi:hypothetical protein
MEDLSTFEIGPIIGAHLAGVSVTKAVTLLGVSRATVSKVMSVAYTNHGKLSVKRNSVGKSTLTERDCFTLRRTVSKTHRTTATQVTAELNVHLEDHFHKNYVTRVSNSNTHSRAAIAKPLNTKSNDHMCKRWCQDHKTWTSSNKWNCVIW